MDLPSDRDIGFAVNFERVEQSFSSGDFEFTKVMLQYRTIKRRFGPQRIELAQKFPEPGSVAIESFVNRARNQIVEIAQELKSCRFFAIPVFVLQRDRKVHGSLNMSGCQRR